MKNLQFMFYSVMMRQFYFQMGLLSFLCKGEQSKDLLKLITTARIGYTLYDKVSKKKKIQQAQASF